MQAPNGVTNKHYKIVIKPKPQFKPKAVPVVAYLKDERSSESLSQSDASSSWDDLELPDEVNMLPEEAFGDDFEQQEFETLEPKKEIEMRAYTLTMPQTFKNGYEYMQKMDEMMRYEFMDVEDKVLFTFDLRDFHTDHD